MVVAVGVPEPVWTDHKIDIVSVKPSRPVSGIVEPETAEEEFAVPPKVATPATAKVSPVLSSEILCVVGATSLRRCSRRWGSVGIVILDR